MNSVKQSIEDYVHGNDSYPTMHATLATAGIIENFLLKTIGRKLWVSDTFGHDSPKQGIIYLTRRWQQNNSLYCGTNRDCKSSTT